MALTRAFLRGMSLTDEQIGAIVEAHADTVSALKDERDAERDKAQKALDDLKALQEKGGEWQERYEKEHSDFEAYKKDQLEKASRAEVEKAYRALLKDAGVSDKRIDTVIKCEAAKIAELALDKDGKLKDAAKLTEGIKAEWSDFIVSTEKKGADTVTPPKNDGGKVTKTMDEILAIKDPAARQQAIAENPSAFGI